VDTYKVGLYVLETREEDKAIRWKIVNFEFAVRNVMMMKREGKKKCTGGFIYTPRG
jgi:hypothetical protein